MVSRDEILKMESGREIDALVAELMGWADIHFNGPVDRLANRWYGKPSEQKHQSEIPFYSTDMSAAWLVVEKMRADGWHINLSVDKDFGIQIFQSDEKGWLGKRFWDSKVELDGEDLPLLVSRAFLLALLAVAKDEVTR